MSNTFTLDDLRAAVEEKYAPVRITLSDGKDVVLRNLLRLNKTERATVLDLLEEFRGVVSEAEDEEEINEEESVDKTLETAQKILVAVADKGRGKKLVEELGDDLALTIEVVERWMEVVKPGEAQNSPA